MELSKNIALLICRNADAAVPDFDSQHARTAAAPHHYSACLRITNSIRYEVEEDTLEQNEIAANPGAVRDHAQSQILFLCCGREGHLDPLEQLVDREGRDAWNKHAGIKPRHVQKRVEQLIHGGDGGIDAR